MAKIKCKVNEDLTIVLDNVQKTHGHDDSLPFQADIYVKSEKLGFPKLTRVGYAFNDGWGGDTIIKSASHQHILNTINGILMNNYQIHLIYMTVPGSLMNELQEKTLKNSYVRIL